MKKTFLLLVCLIGSKILLAQILDANFHSPLPIRAPYMGKMLTQPDGKYLLGGEIAFYGTQRVRGLVRLNSDGSLDNTFHLSFSEDLFIADIELQSTGDIVVMGRLYDGPGFPDYTKSALYQFSSTGVFKKIVEGFSGLRSLSLQSDDKVLVCGGPTLLRYNSDLTVDGNFNDAVSFDDEVTDVQQSGSSLIVSGRFSKVNGITKNDLVKLALNGNVDNSFDTGAGTDDDVLSIAVQIDGKILLVKSSINSFNGIAERQMVRLNVDGSVDTSFDIFDLNDGVSSIFLNGNDIFITGFDDHLIKLSEDGSIDLSFAPVQLSTNGRVGVGFAPCSDGFVINNTPDAGNAFGISKFDHAGKKINGFAPEVARFGTFTTGSYFNGKLLAAGDFVRVDGFETYGVVSLNANGTVNQGFALSANLGEVVQLKVLSDENVLVSTRYSFVKLNSSGVIQPDFSWSPFKVLFQIEKFVVLDNGKIVVGGPGVYRLNTDGSEDTSFDIGSGFASGAFDFDIQATKVIFGSMFNRFNGVPVHQIVRINENGSLDLTFDVGSGPGSQGPPNIPPNIFMIKVLDNNEVLAAGYNNSFNGVEVPHQLVKLSADGVVDLSFNENQKLGPGMEDVGVYPQDNIVKQIGSRVVIGQRHSTPASANAIYVINLDGTVDTNFKIPTPVGFLNDLITGTTPVIESGRVGVTQTASENIEMFALGSFKLSTQADPALLVRLSVNPNGLADQVITFNSLPVKTIGAANFDLAAVATSGLPVEFTSSNTSVAIVTGSTVTITGVGSTVITATQAGNVTYNPAADVTLTLIVNKADQSIAFSSLSAHKVGDDPFLLSATSSSGLAVQFSTASDKVSIDGNQVSIVKPGSVTIDASQSGNDSFNGAAPIDQTFCINPAKPAVTKGSDTSAAIQLTSSADVGNQWYLNGVVVQDAIEKVYTPTIDGSYSVKVSVDGCVSELSDPIVFSITGIDEPVEANFFLYPNPVSSVLHIDLSAFSGNEDVEISIYDGFGSQVEKIWGQKTAEVTAAPYSTGIYLLVASQKGKRLSSRFVKQ